MRCLRDQGNLVHVLQSPKVGSAVYSTLKRGFLNFKIYSFLGLIYFPKLYTTGVSIYTLQVFVNFYVLSAVADFMTL